MSYFADNDPQDELEYEPFDDVEWTDPDTLDAIDLDAADDAPVLNTDEKPPVSPSKEARSTPKSTPRRPSTERSPQTASSRAKTTADPIASASGEAKTDAQAAPTNSAAPITPPAKPSSAEAGTSVKVAKTPTAPKPDATEQKTATAATQPTAQSEASATDAESDEQEIPPDIYCALLVLPAEVNKQILDLREKGDIVNMPPPGIILSPQFRAMDIEPIQTVLSDWVRAQLPVQIELTGIGAHIVGAHQYVAAWTLEPAEELQEAFHALRRALASLILPIAGTGSTIGVHIMIGDRISPNSYPIAIGYMQRDFSTHVWQTTDLQLVRQVPDSDPVQWEIVKTFD